MLGQLWRLANMLKGLRWLLVLLKHFLHIAGGCALLLKCSERLLNEKGATFLLLHQQEVLKTLATLESLYFTTGWISSLPTCNLIAVSEEVHTGALNELLVVELDYV